MPRPPHSKRKRTRHARKKAQQPDSAAPSPTPPDALPDPDTVLAEVPFTSPKGHTYRILVTDQTDAYDPPLDPPKPPKKPDVSG